MLPESDTQPNAASQRKLGAFSRNSVPQKAGVRRQLASAGRGLSWFYTFAPAVVRDVCFSGQSGSASFQVSVSVRIPILKKKSGPLRFDRFAQARPLLGWNLRLGTKFSSLAFGV